MKKLHFSSTPINTQDGKKIFRFDAILDGERRLAVPSVTVPTKPGDPDNTDGTGLPEPPAADGMVRDSWRLISCVQAWPTTGMPWPQMVDYGHDNGRVLKEAVEIINSRRPDLTWNHSTDSKDVAGYVEGAAWEDSSDIPAGINATLVVDPAYDAKAAMGLEKGLIRNGSIGVSMDVEPSHPDMAWEEFVLRQGEEVNGQTVRWLPTQMFAVRHMALVPAGSGADPNAGKRVSGDNTDSGNGSKQKEGSGMSWLEFMQAILEKLGIERMITDNSVPPSDTTKTLVNGRVDSILGAAQKYTGLVDALEVFGKTIAAEGQVLSAQDIANGLPALHQRALVGDRLVEFKAKEAVEWFDKAKFSPEKTELTEAEKRIRTRIEKSTDLDYLEDMIVEYRGVAEAKFTDSRRSSTGSDLPNHDGVKSPPVIGNSDIRESAKRLFSQPDKK